jgi:Protein of unknown function (DUF1449)
MLFDLNNLPYWVFLGIGILLFLLVIISGGGDDDIDTDVDVDVDVDSGTFDLDTDTDIDGEEIFTPLQILGWLGIGKAPLILLLAIDFSSWGVMGWIFNVLISSITGNIPQKFFGLGGVVLITSLSGSLYIGRLVAKPIGKIFASFGEDTSSNRLIGCLGTVVSKQIPYYIEGKIGQVDVIDSSRNLVTINVTLPDWAKVIPYRGQEVIVIDQNEHSYLVICKNSSDEDKWLERVK